jgi:hypothetical protein
VEKTRQPQPPPAAPPPASEAPSRQAAEAPAVVPDARPLEERRIREARQAEAAAARGAQDLARGEDERRWVETSAPLAAKLEALVESDDRTALEESLRALHAVPAPRGRLGSAAEEMYKRLDMAKGKASMRLADLREAESWRRWANVPKLEAQIARAEALLGSPETDGRRIQQELRALQAEWKAIGPAPREKADGLWGRWKEITDEIYARAQQGVVVLDADRSANLEKKKELIARAEAAVDSTDGKATPELYRQLQAEWNAIGPVPRGDSEGIWQRFREVSHKFAGARREVEGQLEADRTANLARLAALCEKAEALRGSTEWKTTAEAFKTLQAEWKSIGQAGKTRAEVDQLWQRFRTACDAFFERRQASFAREDEKRAANLRKKEAILIRAEAIAEGDDVPDPDAVIRGLMTEWKQVGPIPRDQADDLWTRFRAACDKIRSPTPVDSEGAAVATLAAAFSNRPLEAIAKKLQS